MARTIIGSSIMLDGTIDGEPAVVVQGSVKGAITGAAEVTVEKGAEVEAEIDTDTLSVAGKLRGKVTAKSKVSIGPEGKMVGDIRSPRILIADGAQFKGNIDME